MSLSIESTFWLASATPERALALASVTSVRTFPLASARAERATRTNVAITTEHKGTSAALFNTTLRGALAARAARAHTHSGPQARESQSPWTEVWPTQPALTLPY